MRDYPGWIDGTPHTDSSAKVNKYRNVNNIRAIQVNKASLHIPDESDHSSGVKATVIPI